MDERDVFSRLARAPLALLAGGVLALGACSDSTTDPDDHDDHADEVEGVMLVLGGQTLASYDGDTRRWTGELEIDEEEESGHISVRFTDHDGDAVQLGEDFYLDVNVADESIAEFEQDTPGEFGGHLHGHKEGETEVTFSLMHGAVGSGHADFVTQPVHIHVHEHEEG